MGAAADDDDVDDNTGNVNGVQVEEENDKELENYFDAAQLFIPPQPDLELNTPRPMSQNTSVPAAAAAATAAAPTTAATATASGGGHKATKS